jgi:hypothetical protein
MNFSADEAGRKWSSAWHASGKMSVVQAFMLVACVAFVTQANAAVPLPRPRPAEAPQADGGPAQAGQDVQQAPGHGSANSEAVQAKPAEPSACRLALTESIAIAPTIPAIRGPGGCGGEDLVRLEAIVLSPTLHVVVKPAAILRCTMAAAVADWIRTDMAPLAAHLGTTLSELDNFDSFECRGRNRVKGGEAIRAWTCQCARCARAQTCQRGHTLADGPYSGARHP